MDKMTKEKEYQMCTRCVMDTTDPDIVFDNDGVCGHCHSAQKKLKEFYFFEPEKKKIELDRIVSTLKKEGDGKKYDCVIGLSGGVDSSYLAYFVVKKLGLRPLAVHLDNGWNSELAVNNIENIVNKLNIDLYTHVIDWDEFRRLQLSFLKASVVDLELLTDHAISVVINKLTEKFNIKYFLNGHNFQAESIMPASWLYPAKHDSLNIKSIYKFYNNGKFDLKTYPTFSFLEFLKFGKRGIKNISLLNYMEYERDVAVKNIEEELGWRDYGGKHFESNITKFYQSYILPTKFNIDKRKAHLSSLINSGQISRVEALAELSVSYDKFIDIKHEMEYFCKKMEISIEQFQELMSLPVNPHSHFKSYTERKNRLTKLLQNTGMLKYIQSTYKKA